MKQILKKKNAFTLIELLVVIVILGILMAVALPTFLRQQNKAKDSAVKQYLTTAWKAEKTAAVDTQNAFNKTIAVQESNITQSEPELTVYAPTQHSSMVGGTSATRACTTTASAANNKIYVAPKPGGGATSTSVYLYARSGDGHVFAIVGTSTAANGGINNNQSPVFSQLC